MNTAKRIIHNLWCDITNKCGIQPEDNDEYIASWQHQEQEANTATIDIKQKGIDAVKRRDLLREMGRK